MCWRMEVLGLISSQNSWDWVWVSKPKPKSYNLRMANQTTTKPMGLIRDLKIYFHNNFYINTFIVLHNSVVDYNYFMLLGRPWLRDAKVAND